MRALFYSAVIKSATAIVLLPSKQSKFVFVANMVHTKCRGSHYPKTNEQIVRFPVPDESVAWDVPFSTYQPTVYCSDSVKGKEWADPEISPMFIPKWNELEGKINRKSHDGAYQISPEGFPLNPRGRTGVKGRGCLGRWGPNHAADPIVTRWKRNSNGRGIVNLDSNKLVLQFVAIRRRDNGEWAIPGGMVDPGEMVTTTLKREFKEEALNSLEKNEEQLSEIGDQIDSFFSSGNEIYRGYVDDPRNTDNAWMETVAFNFHDDTGKTVGGLSLNAGDDAAAVRWMDIDRNMQLYASHSEFIEKVVNRLNGHW